MSHAVPLTAQMTAQQIGQVSYGVACAEVADLRDTECTAVLQQLIGALVDRAGQDRVMESFLATDFASLAWALGLWGTIWGLACLGASIQDTWMSRFLLCSDRVINEFDATGLGHLGWALGTMGFVPDKIWLRSYVGQVNARVKNFFAVQLVHVFEGLLGMGYKPREEICFALLGQARRHMHSFTATQFAIMLRCIAAFEKWTPQRQFLYDFVTHSRPKLRALRVAEASSILWSFAKLKYMPEESYTLAVFAQVQDTMYTADGEALSQVLWAAAVFRLRLPTDWRQEWSNCALKCSSAFSGPALAHSLWALAQLGGSPPSEELMSALLKRAKLILPTMSCMELSMLYGYRPEEQEWWLGFWNQSDSRWEGATAGQLCLMTVALAELVKTAPSRSWQQNLVRALQLKLKKPSTSDKLGALMLKQAASLGAIDKQLPDSAWLNGVLLETARRWGFARTLSARW
eukprot:gene32134-16659_t